MGFFLFTVVETRIFASHRPEFMPIPPLPDYIKFNFDCVLTLDEKLPGVEEKHSFEMFFKYSNKSGGNSGRLLLTTKKEEWKPKMQGTVPYLDEQKITLFPRAGSIVLQLTLNDGLEVKSETASFDKIDNDPNINWGWKKDKFFASIDLKKKNNELEQVTNLLLYCEKSKSEQ